MPWFSLALNHFADSGICSSCMRNWHLRPRNVKRIVASIGKRFVTEKGNGGAEEEEHDERKYTHHWIGSPDPVSNLRRFLFARQKNPNKYDVMLEKAREETHAWNNKFWTYHNNKFFEEKKKFSKELDAKGISDKEASDEMSQFYKYFLDQHYELHTKYNREWYRRNFGMLLIAILASLTRIFRR